MAGHGPVPVPVPVPASIPVPVAVPVQLFQEATEKRIEKKINLFYLREVVVDEEKKVEDEDGGQSAMVWGVGEYG